MGPVAMEISLKVREARVRRALAKHDFRLAKTPSRSWLRRHYETGYMVINANGFVVAGCANRAFQATIEDVEEFAFAKQSMQSCMD
jgi:hypothetical protein